MPIYAIINSTNNVINKIIADDQQTADELAVNMHGTRGIEISIDFPAWGHVWDEGQQKFIEMQEPEGV